MAKWFHTRLRQARELLELSQAQLAEKLGVSGPTISNWENRVTEPWYEQREKALAWIVKTERAGTRAERTRPISRTQEEDDAEPDNDEISSAHRSLRNVNEHWPQSRIAQALNVSQPTISNWIRAGSIPSRYFGALNKLEKELAASTKTQTEARVTPTDVRLEETPYAEWLRAELELRELNAVELAQRSGVNINTLLNLLEGRTEKPQQRTRQRIQSALEVKGEPVKVEPAEQDAWYYVGLDWTKDEIEQVPDEPGVYIIHDRLGRPAYIGVAHKGAGGIRARLRKHNQLRWTSDPRVARTFSYALSARIPSGDPSALAKSLEKLLIKFMGNAILINEKDVEDLAD